MGHEGRVSRHPKTGTAPTWWPGRRSLDDEQAAAGTAVFDACQIAFAEAGVTKELGTDAPGDGDAFSTIESLAKNLVSEGKASNFHTAVAQVAQDRPELYAAYVGEKG